MPIRCFTCGKLVSDKINIFRKKVQSINQDKQIIDILLENEVGYILDELGFERYCCRRMFLTYVPTPNKYMNKKNISLSPDSSSIIYSTYQSFILSSEKSVIEKLIISLKNLYK